MLRQCAEPKAAVKEYCKVVNDLPCCWAAWEALVQLLEASPVAAVAALPLPAHWVTKLFWCKLHLTAHRNKQALALVHELLVDLPASATLQSLAAQALYNLRRMFKRLPKQLHAFTLSSVALQGLKQPSKLMSACLSWTRFALKALTRTAMCCTC